MKKLPVFGALALIIVGALLSCSNPAADSANHRIRKIVSP